jgi:hypothetical protein
VGEWGTGDWLALTRTERLALSEAEMSRSTGAVGVASPTGEVGTGERLRCH